MRGPYDPYQANGRRTHWLGRSRGARQPNGPCPAETRTAAPPVVAEVGPDGVQRASVTLDSYSFTPAHLIVQAGKPVELALTSVTTHDRRGNDGLQCLGAPPGRSAGTRSRSAAFPPRRRSSKVRLDARPRRRATRRGARPRARAGKEALMERLVSICGALGALVIALAAPTAVATGSRCGSQTPASA